MAASDTFSVCHEAGLPTAASDTAGDRFLIRNLLFDGDLTLLAPVLLSDYGAGAIAPDASVAYYATTTGYMKLRLPDGTVLERVRLPHYAGRLHALPDGQRLVVLSDPPIFGQVSTTVTVVDLR